jgi:hypothetical protein
VISPNSQLAYEPKIDSVHDFGLLVDGFAEAWIGPAYLPAAGRSGVAGPLGLCRTGMAAVGRSSPWS